MQRTCNTKRRENEVDSRTKRNGETRENNFTNTVFLLKTQGQTGYNGLHEQTLGEDSVRSWNSLCVGDTHNVICTAWHVAGIDMSHSLVIV